MYALVIVFQKKKYLILEMTANCQVHNVRFFELPPRSAHCLSYSRARNLLALSRADYSIEIWHFGNGNEKQKTKNTVAPVLQRVIPAHDTQGSVEALVWAGGGTKYQHSINNQDTSEHEEVVQYFALFIIFA